MFRRILCALAGVACLCSAAAAGVVNPDISVIGQPFARWTDEAGDAARKRPTLDPGEVEAMFDAALNPYARGAFVLSFGEEGASVEEGYFQLTRGLPGGLAMKGGKYRLGFGKLNAVHPHAIPFAERFNVLATYLPGDESFNDTALQLSERFALPGDVAVTASVDWLKGDLFRIERASSGAPNDPLEVAGPDGAGDRAAEPRPGVLGRVSGFVPIGDRSGLELGLSGAQGTNNVAAATRTTLLGADAKLKLWRSERAYWVVQGEFVKLSRDDAGWDEPSAAYTKTTVEPAGGYLFADYNFDQRYNVGVGAERWQSPDADEVWNTGLRAFAGLALMEETTAFRVDFERVQPGTPAGATEDPEAIHRVTVRVLFSMGPHKAHQF